MRWAGHGRENAIFSYGGELGDVETFQVEGILNSPQAVQALEDYKRLFSYTPPGWSKAFFCRKQSGHYQRSGRDVDELRDPV